MGSYDSMQIHTCPYCGHSQSGYGGVTHPDSCPKAKKHQEAKAAGRLPCGCDVCRAY